MGDTAALSRMLQRKSEAGAHKPNTKSEKRERDKETEQIPERMARNPLRLKPLPFILERLLFRHHGVQGLQTTADKAPVLGRKLSSEQIHVRHDAKARLQANRCHIVPFTTLTGQCFVRIGPSISNART